MPEWAGDSQVRLYVELGLGLKLVREYRPLRRRLRWLTVPLASIPSRRSIVGRSGKSKVDRRLPLSSKGTEDALSGIRVSRRKVVSIHTDFRRLQQRSSRSTREQMDACLAAAAEDSLTPIHISNQPNLLPIPPSHNLKSD